MDATELIFVLRRSMHSSVSAWHAALTTEFVTDLQLSIRDGHRHSQLHSRSCIHRGNTGSVRSTTYCTITLDTELSYCTYCTNVRRSVDGCRSHLTGALPRGMAVVVLLQCERPFITVLVPIRHPKRSWPKSSITPQHTVQRVLCNRKI